MFILVMLLFNLGLPMIWRKINVYVIEKSFVMDENKIMKLLVTRFKSYMFRNTLYTWQTIHVRSCLLFQELQLFEINATLQFYFVTVHVSVVLLSFRKMSQVIFIECFSMLLFGIQLSGYYFYNEKQWRRRLGVVNYTKLATYLNASRKIWPGVV